MRQIWLSFGNNEPTLRSTWWTVGEAHVRAQISERKLFNLRHPVSNLKALIPTPSHRPQWCRYPPHWTRSTLDAQPFPPLKSPAQPINSSVLLCPVPLDLSWLHSLAPPGVTVDSVRRQPLQFSATKAISRYLTWRGYLSIIHSTPFPVPEPKLIPLLLDSHLFPKMYVQTARFLQADHIFLSFSCLTISSR